MADASANRSTAGDEPVADVPLAMLRCAPEGTTASVVARWSGMLTLREFSPAYGFHHLRFQFPEGEELEFHPEAAPFPGDWTCNIFSPGCRYVALLLSDSRGYHVVELRNLRAYLAGRRPPLAFLHYSGSLPEPRYGSSYWVSPTEFEFFVFNPSRGDGWREAESERLRADLSAAREGAELPLQVIHEPLAEPPDDGCAAADVRP